nr:unnamed protein product [Digitaria exilis]
MDASREEAAPADVAVQAFASRSLVAGMPATKLRNPRTRPWRPHSPAASKLAAKLRLRRTVVGATADDRWERRSRSSPSSPLCPGAGQRRKASSRRSRQKGKSRELGARLNQGRAESAWLRRAPAAVRVHRAGDSTGSRRHPPTVAAAVKSWGEAAPPR